MIQRIQTVWLLLAGAAGVLMYRLPIWQHMAANQTAYTKYFASENLLMFLMEAAAALCAFAAVFLFRNRGLQKTLALLGTLLGIALLAWEFFKVEEMKRELTPARNMWQLGALMPVAMIVFFLLAHGAIRRDEKLIRSLDRLR
jgi:hypothetical protein